MVAVSMKFRFGARYDNYVNKVKDQTIKEIDRPKTHHGRLDAGWDDYEQDIVEEMGKANGVRLPRGG
tara:strand:+ start:1253 stop:1453 length:201 start_codon:yes stop_codon:yes gene_type:complete